MLGTFIFVSLLILGKSRFSQDIDVYLKSLIDDIKVLWADGVQEWKISLKDRIFKCM